MSVREQYGGGGLPPTRGDVMAQAAKITDCPTRPPCPTCGMSMITTDYIEDGGGFEHCEFKCLKCGHVEISKPAKH
jgi:predicted RNA-binding Zn-ribbon protein involved in translation (DUF1610 family)